MSPQGTDTGKAPDSSKRRGQSAHRRPPSRQLPRDKDPDVLKYDAEGEPLSLAEEIADEVARSGEDAHDRYERIKQGEIHIAELQKMNMTQLMEEARKDSTLR